jgi:hypothetical protein
MSESFTGHGRQHFTDADYALWIALRKENGIEGEPDYDHPDVWHSDLLDRIATGGPVFQEAPPKAYSYPWVSLMQDGFSPIGHENPIEVPWSLEGPWSENGALMLLIDQSLWQITEQYDFAGKPAWKVRYRDRLPARVEWRAHYFVHSYLDNQDHELACYGIWLDDGPAPQRLGLGAVPVDR